MFKPSGPLLSFAVDRIDGDLHQSSAGQGFVKKVGSTPDRGVLSGDFRPKSDFFNKAAGQAVFP